MRTLVRCAVVTIGISMLLAARSSAVNNPIIVTIADGPLAGRYQSDAADTYCMRQKAHETLSATWQAVDVQSARSFSLASLNVYDIDGAGQKYGDVRVAFGDFQRRPQIYEVAHGPLAMTTEGKSAVISFDGTTKEGIRLAMRATCAQIEEL